MKSIILNEKIYFTKHFDASFSLKEAYISTEVSQGPGQNTIIIKAGTCISPVEITHNRVSTFIICFKWRGTIWHGPFATDRKCSLLTKYYGKDHYIEKTSILK